MADSATDPWRCLRPDTASTSASSVTKKKKLSESNIYYNDLVPESESNIYYDSVKLSKSNINYNNAVPIISSSESKAELRTASHDFWE